MELDPRAAEPHAYLGWIYSGRQQHDQAIAELERAVELSGRNQIWLASLASAYAKAGRKKEVEAILDEFQSLSKRQRVSPYWVAWALVGAGKKKEAIAALEQAYEEGWGQMTFLKVASVWNPLRSDPRFQSLLRRMNFPE